MQVIFRHMCRTGFLIAGLILIAAAGTAPAAARSEKVERLRIGAEERTYLLSLPDATGPEKPRPTIIALHAAGQTSDGLRDYLGLEPAADREGYVTVYPQGINRVWNDGRPAAMRLKALLTPGDDVPFLVALTQRLVEQGIADPARIYLTGISNGGFMVERMACEFSGLYAAYAVAMATAPANYREECRPDRPVPIMFVHGTADGVIAWDGFWTPLGATLSAPDSAALFARLDGCAETTLTPLPDIEPLDGTTVSVRRWSDCTGGVEVVLYRIERGGHQSPARTETKPGLATPLLGLRNRDIDMGEEALAFFARYPAPLGLAPAGARVPLPTRSPLKDGAQRRAERPLSIQPQRGISTQ
ncbi:alpha/beta hydrolase family esterase [Aquabacter spiritensis]|uniref:Polyhydroxybutyrate depolymerase n=1 Tax=Aquabacter spiritensis TaxID=933073 RepID=A0A4R3LKW1_9HYPH|nr:PHB depolymerase family esterase [Aquabacter spiritensis]TCT00541.1 polyhydroxybutyrate depolymerase [Aquabacter spiritensis]